MMAASAAGQQQLDAMLERLGDEPVVAQATAALARLADHPVLSTALWAAHLTGARQLETLGRGSVGLHLGHEIPLVPRKEGGRLYSIRPGVGAFFLHPPCEFSRGSARDPGDPRQ